MNTRVVCGKTGRSEIVHQGSLTGRFFCGGCGAPLRRPVTWHPTMAPERNPIEGDEECFVRENSSAGLPTTEPS